MSYRLLDISILTEPFLEVYFSTQSFQYVSFLQFVFVSALCEFVDV